MMDKKRLTVTMSGMAPVIQEIIAAGGTAEITVMGNSMFPMLKHGVSRVKLAAPPESLRAGDLPFYRRRNGAFILHRVIKVRGDEYLMCGDNQYILERGIKQTDFHKSVRAVVADLFLPYTVVCALILFEPFKHHI